MTLRSQIHLRLLLSLMDGPASIQELAQSRHWKPYGDEAPRTIQIALSELRHGLHGPDPQGRYALTPATAAALAAATAGTTGGTPSARSSCSAADSEAK